MPPYIATIAPSPGLIATRPACSVDVPGPVGMLSCTACDRRVLGLLVDRGGDPQATAVELGLGQLELGAQLLLHVRGDVADRPGPLVLVALAESTLGNVALARWAGVSQPSLTMPSRT